MSNFNHQKQERTSRHHAADRLVDIAYMLTAGGPLELSVDGRRIQVPVGTELHLEQGLTAEADRVELQVTLTWVSPEA